MPVLAGLFENPLYPGEAGWGDVLFVAIWAFGTLLLAASADDGDCTAGRPRPLDVSPRR
jgi:hypothetical protein